MNATLRLLRKELIKFYRGFQKYKIKQMQKIEYLFLLNKSIRLDVISTKNKKEFVTAAKYQFYPELIFVKPNKLNDDAGKLIDFQMCRNY